MAKYTKSLKKQRKDGGATQHYVTEQIRVKQILGDVLELVATAESAAQLRKVLNSAAWKIKKATLMESLELNQLGRANRLATEILNLTEVKKKAIEGNINYNENVNILMAEITDVPFEYLEQRATALREGGQSRTGANRRGDETPASDEVLLVEAKTVQG
jgi:hypothetical protein